MLDVGFGNAGAARIAIPDGTYPGVFDLKVQPDGRLLAVFGYSGAPYTYGVARFQLDGAADASFGTNGLWMPQELSTIDSIALQADGNIVLGGADRMGDFGVARYLNGPSVAIEFYNAGFDHYFVTMNPQEVSDLDSGIHIGWVRTGKFFPVYGSQPLAPPGFAPVCRYYIPPQHGDSHFLSASADECASVMQKTLTDPNYSGYVYESPNAFYVALPDVSTGTCPAATTPIYRLWNNRADSNHRYTADAVTKAQMMAKGWIPEGYGPDAVSMCAPQ
jgi:uncharacterized protein DUF5648/beta-propeller uncharacterized protein DUF5122